MPLTKVEKAVLRDEAKSEDLPVKMHIHIFGPKSDMFLFVRVGPRGRMPPL